MKQTIFDDLSIHDVKGFLSLNKVKRVFFVTGRGSYNASGAQDFIDEALQGLEVFRFSDFDQNPKLDEALAGTKEFLSFNPDAVIAIGGGSVLDMAKLVNIFSMNMHSSAFDILSSSLNIIHKGKPFFAVPTTAGTGSEATHFAVVYHNKKKYSIAHPFILPDYVGLNSRFLLSQNPYLIACTGMDAFSQAIESYWSVGASAESKAFAVEAIKLINTNLVNAVNEKSANSLKQLLLGSFYAGKAINISKTTAPHALSYAFTTFYNIPHGHAVFLTLPSFLMYNYDVSEKDCNHPLGYKHVKQTLNDLSKLFSCNDVLELKVYLLNYIRSLSIELSPSKLGIHDFEEMVSSNVNLERLGNNPRKIDIFGLESLLKLL